MNNTLIVPIYNELQKVKNDIATLDLSEAADIAYEFVIGLSEHDGELLEDWLITSSNNLAGFNLFVLEDSARFDDVLTLYGPMKAIADSPTAINNMLNNSAVRAKMLLTNSSLQAIVESSVAMSFVADSQSVMQDFAASSLAMDEIIANTAALNTVVASQVAMDVIVASQVAMDAVAASQVAMDAVIADANALNSVVGSAIAMDAVVANQMALQAFFGSAAPTPPHVYDGDWQSSIIPEGLRIGRPDTSTPGGVYVWAMAFDLTNHSTLSLTLRKERINGSAMHELIRIGGINVRRDNANETYPWTTFTFDVSALSGTNTIEVGWEFTSSGYTGEYWLDTKKILLT